MINTCFLMNNIDMMTLISHIRSWFLTMIGRYVTGFARPSLKDDFRLIRKYTVGPSLKDHCRFIRQYTIGTSSKDPFHLIRKYIVGPSLKDISSY